MICSSLLELIQCNEREMHVVLTHAKHRQKLIQRLQRLQRRGRMLADCVHYVVVNGVRQDDDTIRHRAVHQLLSNDSANEWLPVLRFMWHEPLVAVSRCDTHCLPLPEFCPMLSAIQTQRQLRVNAVVECYHEAIVRSVKCDIDTKELPEIFAQVTRLLPRTVSANAMNELVHNGETLVCGLAQAAIWQTRQGIELADSEDLQKWFS